MDWLDLLAVQGTLKSLPQHHNSRASILRHSVFFMVQPSNPYMTTEKTIALTRRTFVGKVMSLLFNMLSRFVMRNAGLEEAQAGIKIAGRNINNLRYADDTTLMAESEEELRNHLMKVKEESEKVGLKLNIQKTKIMASGPITSWEIDGETGETVETLSDFIFGGSKITADGDCSHEINKRCLLLGRKVMTNLDSRFKSRDITLPTKVCLVKTTVFPVVMCGCESWTIRKLSAEELMLLNCGVGEYS